MRERQTWLDDLVGFINNQAWESAGESCFKVLYGLPPDLQIEASCFMMRRYLPIFERKFPRVPWPRQVLDNPYDWVAAHGREVDSSYFGMGEGVFESSFDALVAAIYYASRSESLTSCCVTALKEAIVARMEKVWMADDPEAIEIWLAHYDPNEENRIGLEEFLHRFEGRSSVENVAAIAVRIREWNHVVSWLIDRRVSDYSPANPDDLARDLTIWKERGMFIVIPTEKDV